MRCMHPVLSVKCILCFQLNASCASSCVAPPSVQHLGRGVLSVVNKASDIQQPSVLSVVLKAAANQSARFYKIGSKSSS